MKNKKILLIGGGGHCKSVIDCVITNHQFSKIGIVDNDKSLSSVLGIFVVGCDNDLESLFEKGYRYAFIAIGNSDSQMLRKGLYKKIKAIGYELPKIIDSTAIVSKNTELDCGVFIGKHSIINANTKIGKCSIINTGAIIEHDCMISKFVHIAPGAVLNGNVKIGNNTFVGSNSVIRQQLKIGKNAIIGLGSVVTKDIMDNSLAYGNPCKVIRSIE